MSERGSGRNLTLGEAVRCAAAAMAEMEAQVSTLTSQRDMLVNALEEAMALIAVEHGFPPSGARENGEELEIAAKTTPDRNDVIRFHFKKARALLSALSQTKEGGA